MSFGIVKHDILYHYVSFEYWSLNMQIQFENYFEE